VSALGLSSNPAALVYGTILVATLLAAESPKRETYVDALASVVIALLVYWLSIAYSQVTGERIRDEEPFTFSAFRRAAAHERPVIYGALGPLLVLLVCWVAGAGLNTAVNIAIWAAAAIIVATEIAIGIRADLTGRQLVIQTGMGVVLGLSAEALRVLLH
jgi:glycerol uptake facilitator-like aquaporin